MNSEIKLIEKSKCTGCQACYNACPIDAISMKEDEYGYIYPIIDEDKCIKCGVCCKVCLNKIDNNNRFSEIQNVFAAQSIEEEVLKNSASGGMFYLIAYKWIENGGIVYGASTEIENNNLIIKHIQVQKLEDLKKLQGSKYVQSNVGNIYKIIKKQLEDNQKILFSGTPCQVDGLKKFLNKNYDNLLTIDIICHGVPNNKMFQEYINILMEKLNGKIKMFRFRDKKRGWGLNASIEYECEKTNKKRKKIIPCELSSYYSYFLDGSIYRESCYRCQFATSKRVSDLTLGDFWGIRDEHKDLVKFFDVKKGVSCVLVNTAVGEMFLDSLENIKLHDSNFEKVAKNNKQLKTSSNVGKNRNKVLELYKCGGYKAIENDFEKKIIKRKILFYLKKIIPKRIKMMIKKLNKEEK